ncbi:MAG: hypothetical protein IPP46_12465 [Bacteroidetes bacterium]|nr:hypothetical protein [Bacteroidota bacterium]
MKIKIYSLFCYLFLLTLQTNAQNILQLKTDPAQPTTNTPVKLIADVQFSSGDCKDKTLLIRLEISLRQMRYIV